MAVHNFLPSVWCGVCVEARREGKQEGIFLNLQLSDFYTLKGTRNTVVPDKLPRDVGIVNSSFSSQWHSCRFFLVTRSRGTVLCVKLWSIFPELDYFLFVFSFTFSFNLRFENLLLQDTKIDRKGVWHWKAEDNYLDAGKGKYTVKNCTVYILHLCLILLRRLNQV
jgi:hypothetical protein